MAVRKELVLYYTPEKSADDQKLKGVLVRLGIRIRNITPDQIYQKVGYLAGLPGFEEEPDTESKEAELKETGRKEGGQKEAGQKAAGQKEAGQKEAEQQEEGFSGGNVPAQIPEKVLVLHGFGERKLNEMLNQFRKSKVPPIALKAVLTEHNCGWSFYELYQELRQEHEKMNARQEKEYEKMSAGAEEASVKEES